MRDLIIAAAAPGFILLIFVELLVGWVRGFNTYRLADSVSSISLGVLSQVIGVFTAVVGYGVYSLAFEHLSLTALPGDAWWTWAIALVGYDLCYYWQHRKSHEVNVLWASHVVHHSSEEYNLSTALRQPSTGVLLNWLFYWPLAVIGVPPGVFALAATINLLYQYWIHTRQIGRLGWFDRWFASPSNHRVHHGQNDYCLDRNYGGMLMIWDRVFGTFSDEREGEEIVYGIRGPLRSWSPIRGNLHYYGELVRSFLLADTWRDRLKVWVAHPGWRPAAVERVAPKPRWDPARFEKFAPATTRAVALYAFLHFAVAVPLAVHFLVVQTKAPWQVSLGYAALLTATLWVLGGLLEGRALFVRLELARILLLGGAIVATRGWFGGVTFGPVALAAVLTPLAVSLGSLVLIARRPVAPPLAPAA